MLLFTCLFHYRFQYHPIILPLLRVFHIFNISQSIYPSIYLSIIIYRYNLRYISHGLPILTALPHILTSCYGPTWIAIRLKHCQPCCQVPQVSQAEGAVVPLAAQMAVLKLMASSSWPRRRKVRSQSWASDGHPKNGKNRTNQPWNYGHGTVQKDTPFKTLLFHATVVQWQLVASGKLT